MILSRVSSTGSSGFRPTMPTMPHMASSPPSARAAGRRVGRKPRREARDRSKSRGHIAAPASARSRTWRIAPTNSLAVMKRAARRSSIAMSCRSRGAVRDRFT